MSELIVLRAVNAFEQVGDGWTIYGRAVRYGVKETVSDDFGQTWYDEEWEPHAFDRDVAAGGRWVNLLAGHDGLDADVYLGRAKRLETRPDGLYAEVGLEKDHPLAEDARTGRLTRWSVGAAVTRSVVRQDGTKVRMAAGLRHIAAVASKKDAREGEWMAQGDGTGVLAYRGTPKRFPRREEWRRRYPVGK
jgi:uncharacterized protein YwbE